MTHVVDDRIGSLSATVIIKLRLVMIKLTSMHFCVLLTVSTGPVYYTCHTCTTCGITKRQRVVCLGWVVD